MVMKVLRTSRVSVVALATCALLLFASTALTQAKKPITRQGLVNAVKIRSSAPGLVQDIKTRGVDFQMTAATESELRSAGATNEIIETARANFRPPRKRRSPTMP
jgi:hypothetical protein